jgi:hypothetical protein
MMIPASSDVLFLKKHKLRAPLFYILFRYLPRIDQVSDIKHLLPRLDIV